MAGKFALIIGNSHYEDSSLGRLKAPDVDVHGLERVLKSPDVGHFDEVTTLLNESCASVRKAVARFYDQRQRDDLLLVYFSGHGVKDEQGHLYLALRDTESKLLAGTALETAFISARMDRSFSKRLVLVLDCCHSGAFANGSKAAQGVSVGTAEALEGTGLGRVVLTATDSTQYAWEGDRVIGDAQNSLFTHFMIEGLETGAADRDDDGTVTVDELYDYVHEHVITTTPLQTPYKWSYRQEGEIVLAQNPFAKRSSLPPEIEEAISSKLSSMRLEGVRELKTLLRGHHVGRVQAALAALKTLSLDDSRKVANEAIETLKLHEQEERNRVGSVPASARVAVGKKPVEAERVVTEPNVAFAVAPGAAAVPINLDSIHALHAEIEHALTDATPQNPEPPASTDERSDARPSDIFISYAHEDFERARALANVLTARGWKVWWDRKIAFGEAFDVVIERELGTCKCAIVLWSARSVGATWVRNEARRAARRKVLVPILIDAVETPLEFENLQAADLTSWKTAEDHPEFEAVFDRINALSPIPFDRLAQITVDDARRAFGAGRREAALAKLEQFRPANDVVRRALGELRAESARIERARAEAENREAESTQRERQIAAEKARLETLELLARHAVEDARSTFDSGRHDAAIANLEQFRPAHELVTRAITELRAETARIARDRDEAARRESERVAQERAEAERRESERIARERAEAERRESERVAQERADAASRESERIARERAEAARRAAEAALPKLELETERAHFPAALPTHGDSDADRAPAMSIDAIAVDEPLPAPSWSRYRPALATAAVLLLLVGGTRLTGLWPARAPDIARNEAPPSAAPAQVITVPAPRPAATPAVEPPKATPPIDTQPPKPAPTDNVAPAPGPVQGPVAPVTPAPVVPATKQPASPQLEELKARARTQQLAGQRPQALSTVVEGLRIDPRDPALRNMLDLLLREAARDSARAKQEADDLDASARAEDSFGKGLQSEMDAVRQRRAGRIDAATRAYWAAANQFEAAAEASRRIANEEAEQARNRKPAAPAPPQPRTSPESQAGKAALDRDTEADLVRQTLNRYEAAYAGRDVEAVRRVFPTVPLDELKKEFDGYRSITLKVQPVETLFTWTESFKGATVPARVLYDIAPKSGQATQQAKLQTFELERIGSTWFIRRIH